MNFKLFLESLSESELIELKVCIDDCPIDLNKMRINDFAHKYEMTERLFNVLNHIYNSGEYVFIEDLSAKELRNYRAIGNRTYNEFKELMHEYHKNKNRN